MVKVKLPADEVRKEGHGWPAWYERNLVKKAEAAVPGC